MTLPRTYVETYTVQPTANTYNRPPPPSAIALHGMDLLGAPLDIHNHRFFHRPPSHLMSTIEGVIDRLKSSLAEALELYPPVAGTVRQNEKGELYIATGAEDRLGTPFLVEIRDTPYAGDSEELSPRNFMLLPPSSSTLAVKVTQFSCGTIAVAASIIHLVTDLRGFLDFLEIWAQLARGETIDLTRIPDDWSHTPGPILSRFRRNSTRASSRIHGPSHSSDWTTCISTGTIGRDKMESYQKCFRTIESWFLAFPRVKCMDFIGRCTRSSSLRGHYTCSGKCKCGKIARKI